MSATTDTVTYDIGDGVTLAGRWEVDGAPTTPTDASLIVRSPSGIVTVYTLDDLREVEAGLLELDLVVDEAGWWAFRFAGTGLAQASGEGSLYVKRSRILPLST